MAEWPDWSGQIAVVVAAGASANDKPLWVVRGHAFVIVVNESWRLAPWADVLYATDCAWWEKNSGVPQFRGLKVSASPNAAKAFPEMRTVQLVSRAVILKDEPGVIGCGSRFGNGHSGFHAVNLAVQFGAKRIVLVGFDLQGSHWHVDHEGRNNPAARVLAEWCEEMDGCADQFTALGIRVLNASKSSALTTYEKVDLLEAMF